MPVAVYTAEIEPQARQQLVNISQLPIVHHHVAAMPDVHLGIGATVGSVIPTQSAIIPAAVGVDIGCGMIATRLSLTATGHRREVPDEGLQPDLARRAGRIRPARRRDVARCRKPFQKGLKRILEKHPGVQKRIGKNSSWARQLGTLGGGNHFIEVCLDESQAASG